jgi:uncharacterized membrane protein
MHKGRLEAFSDGVMAIIITIMVLELKPPGSFDLSSLRTVLPSLGSYALSFVFIAIYWNNHHHTMQAVKHINGAVLWANQHLLFWLSLIPFATAWMGESRFQPATVFAYGVDLLCCAIAYTIMLRTLIRANGRDSGVAKAVGKDHKGYASLFCYVMAILFALVVPLVSCALYVVVACIWLIPDRRFERLIEASHAEEHEHPTH